MCSGSINGILLASIVNLRMNRDMQMERETWRENGLAPPLPGTDAEKHWAEVDKAVPYTKVRIQVGRAVTGCRTIPFYAVSLNT